MLSKACTYGLLASLHVAKQDAGYVSIREMSGHLGISFHFLTKILQVLTQAGIMRSHKGPNGGVALARPADSITLMEIVTAIDGNALFTQCMLGLPGCGHATPCPMHDHWVGIRAALTDLFNRQTLADTTRDVLDKNLRLAAG